jgi:ankyrin repeat protein
MFLKISVLLFAFYPTLAMRLLSDIELAKYNYEIKMKNSRKEICRRLQEKILLNEPLANEDHIYYKNDAPLLMCSIYYQLFNLIEPLLKAGANPDICDKNKYTPLLYSAENKNYQGIKLLLEYKADPNLQDIHKRTAISIIAEYDWDVADEHDYNHKKDILKILLYHGADPFIKNNNGQTILDKLYYKLNKKNPGYERLAHTIKLLEHAHANRVKTLTSLLSRGITPFPYDIALLIAEIRYAIKDETV